MSMQKTNPPPAQRALLDGKLTIAESKEDAARAAIGAQEADRATAAEEVDVFAAARGEVTDDVRSNTGLRVRADGVPAVRGRPGRLPGEAIIWWPRGTEAAGGRRTTVGPARRGRGVGRAGRRDRRQ